MTDGTGKVITEHAGLLLLFDQPKTGFHRFRTENGIFSVFLAIAASFAGPETTVLAFNTICLASE